MKICFYGLGSIGTRHYKIINRLYDFDCLFGYYRHGTICRFYSEHNQHKQITGKYDVAFITNPTYLHIETAIKAIHDGAKYLFIEKPLDCKLDRLDELLGLVDKNNITAYVAYPFRHHYKMQELRKTYKDQWLYFVCHTDFEQWRPYKTYSHGKEQGGGCLLELSHEVDLAQFLLGKIKSITNSLPTIFDAALDLDVECWLRVEHCNKNLSFHNLNIKQPVEQRFLKFKGGDKIEYSATEDMYERQIRYFFDNLDNPNLENNIFEAADLFKKLIEFKKNN